MVINFWAIWFDVDEYFSYHAWKELNANLIESHNISWWIEEKYALVHSKNANFQQY